MNLIDMTNKEAQAKLGKIGLIAGGGNFPILLVKDMVENKTPFYTVGLKPFAKDELKEVAKGYYQEVTMPNIFKCRKIFKAQGVDTVVLIGSVNPRIIPKLEFLLNIDMLVMGVRMQAYKKKHDAVFRVVSDTFEKAGFAFVGVQDAMPSLMVKAGLLTKTAPSAQDEIDIKLAIEESKKVGESDIGQAAVVKDGKFISSEEPTTGTDGLIKRALEMKNNEQGGVMAKLTKPGQEERGDIPAIGFGTLKSLIDGKLNGIVIEAEYKTILENKEELIKAFDENNIFILAI